MPTLIFGLLFMWTWIQQILRSTLAFRSSRPLLASACGICMALLFSSDASAEESASLKAAMSWNGHGKMLQISPSEMQFLGVIQGILYIDGPEGELDEAFVECTVIQILQIESFEGSAEGNCVLVEDADNTVYAEHRCRGVGGSCEGIFTIMGGTGRFEGAAGVSPLVVRSPLHVIIQPGVDVEDMVIHNGVLLLPDLRVTRTGEVK
ncbi:MAG: hypothetical protein AAGF57_05935 [Pseudomonadota bacterium]